ncbi:hypothetical protein P7C73_g6535, partial [Tremellales sp. Uapishka_1]
MPPISESRLLRVLQRAKQGDELGSKIAKAIELIEGVLDDLGEDAVAMSFNGGKDCERTVQPPLCSGANVEIAFRRYGASSPLRRGSLCPSLVHSFLSPTLAHLDL